MQYVLRFEDQRMLHLIRNSRPYLNSNLNASFLSFGNDLDGCENPIQVLISEFHVTFLEHEVPKSHMPFSFSCPL